MQTLRSGEAWCMPEFRFSPRSNRAHEIPWSPWDAQAFARAQREGKPILLSISAVWCHWCHVMDETTYSDPAVIAKIADRFVPVRVDNDERPDVNARYNMGGWPTTAFLAGDGTTLTGATYLPPPQMERALDEVANWYAENSQEIAEHVEALRASRTPAEPADPEALRAEGVRQITDAIAATFDDECAGFGDTPKFPQPELLEFLIIESQATGEERLHGMAVRTLVAMADGGMYDHVEGGFFRYSTTRDWSVPHFEKMAEEHAGLIRVLALVLERSRAHALRTTLRSTLDYVANVLRDPTSGLFAGSQDADEEYYALPLEERRTHGAPYVDRTVYADRNAALAGALCLGGAALEDDAIVAFGIAALDALHDRMRDADGLLYHVRRPDAAPSVRGLLGDQSAYLRALLDAHEVTGEARFLERAVALVDPLESYFAAADGGFHDHAGIEEPLGRLALPDRPIVDNAILAESYLRLAALCAQERYRATAERTLLRYARTFTNAGPFAAAYARAVRRFLSPEICVRVVGTTEEGADFREAARRLPSPFVDVRSVESDRAATLDLPAQPTPAAYLCTLRTCGPPVRSATDLRAAYDAIGAHDDRRNALQNQQPHNPTSTE